MKLARKPVPPPLRLPAGSFTIDRDGRLLVSTLPSNFPSALVREFGQQIIATFREAHAADIPLTQLVVRYASLKATARELRGGALVFLAPQTPISVET
jgi:hypothetical protein